MHEHNYQKLYYTFLESYINQEQIIEVFLKALLQFFQSNVD